MFPEIVVVSLMTANINYFYHSMELLGIAFTFFSLHTLTLGQQIRKEVGQHIYPMTYHEEGETPGFRRAPHAHSEEQQKSGGK